jgi:hypothetical protein
LDTIRRKFDAVIAQAKTVAESLKKFQENQQRLEAEQDRLDNTDSCRDSVATLSTQPSIDVLHTPKIGAAMDRGHLMISNTLDDMKSRGAFLSTPMAPSDTAGMMTGNIEVDDASDQSSIVVDITQFRMANPRRSRV